MQRLASEKTILESTVVDSPEHFVPGCRIMLGLPSSKLSLYTLSVSAIGISYSLDVGLPICCHVTWFVGCVEVPTLGEGDP